MKNTLTKEIWLHLHSPIKVVGVCEFQQNNLMVFDRGTIVELCVPMRSKGEEEESNTCSTWGDCSRLAVGAWLAGDDAAPVEGEMSTAAAAGESIGEKKLGSAAKGEKKEF